MWHHCTYPYLNVCMVHGTRCGLLLPPPSKNNLPQDDFLSNLTPEAMAPLIGYGAAAAFSFAVRLGYAISMMGSAVLIMFPAREVRGGWRRHGAAHACAHVHACFGVVGVRALERNLLGHETTQQRPSTNWRVCINGKGLANACCSAGLLLTQLCISIAFPPAPPAPCTAACRAAVSLRTRAKSLMFRRASPHSPPPLPPPAGGHRPDQP